MHKRTVHGTEDLTETERQGKFISNKRITCFLSIVYMYIYIYKFSMIYLLWIMIAYFKIDLCRTQHGTCPLKGVSSHAI